MSFSTEETLILRLQKYAYFTLKTDESTGVTNMAQLLVFVRFDYHEGVREMFLICKPVESNTTAENVFNVIYLYVFIGKVYRYLHRRDKINVRSFNKACSKRDESCT